MDPEEQSGLGLHCLSIYEASNSLVDDKNIHFVIVRLKG